jgi:hypothetical protein
VSPNFGFVGGVESKVMSSPPGPVGPVGLDVGFVGSLVGAVGWLSCWVGAVDGGSVGVVDGGADDVVSEGD